MFALGAPQGGCDDRAAHLHHHHDPLRFQAGTDDNSLKNVLAAQAAGEPVREFVDRNADAFVALGQSLSLTVDDVIRTGCEQFYQPAELSGGRCPEHDSQVIYVWFDALCNYVTALGYGSQGNPVPRRLLASHAAVIGPAAAD